MGMAQSAVYGFEWRGGGGYSLRGALSFDAQLLSNSRVLQNDIECFEINGFRDGAPIGRWALGQLTAETTWILTFDSAAEELVVFGPGDPMPQAWNMDGFGMNCGAGGFGFNIGNAAQDICLDGELIIESQVPPPTPISTRRLGSFEFAPDACRGVQLFSHLR